MRERILAFVQRLRAAAIDVSVAEALDAMAGVAAAGVERETLRETLAATLIKDEADRATFDRLFELAFPTIGPAPDGDRRRQKRARGGGDAETARGGQRGERSAGRIARPETPEKRSASARRAADHEGTEARERVGRPARRRALLTLPFHEMTPRDVAEARDVVRELGARLRGRLARRERGGRRGRLDFRRTIRAATPAGGVPARLHWRARRPGRPDLVALCDVSGSVAAASELGLGLLAPAAPYFRRVHFFAYVDRLVPVSIENGHVAPAGRLDVYARSDFGHVLADLWNEHRPLLTGSTLLLVIGDARNNRRPPRGDLFRTIAARVQRVVWLAPEPRTRWNTGDSVLDLYGRECDAVVEVVDLRDLMRAVRRTV